MEYNSTRNKLVLSEYGRNVQRMVEYLTEIEDPAKRKEQAEVVIEIMGQLNPNVKNVDDFRHKLYDHLIMMSDFNLEVDSGFPAPAREEVFKKPEPLKYPQSEFRHRHYGKNVEQLIEKAKAMDDAEKKQEFAHAIGNYMKLVHSNWNNENVPNEVIIADMERMSKGELQLEADTNLDLLPRPTSNNNNNNRNNNNRRRKGGGGKRNNNYKRRK